MATPSRGFLARALDWSLGTSAGGDWSVGGRRGKLIDGRSRPEGRTFNAGPGFRSCFLNISLLCVSVHTGLQIVTIPAVFCVDSNSVFTPENFYSNRFATEKCSSYRLVGAAPDSCCPCVAGYARTAGSSVCNDIDECTDGSATCSAGTTCTNTPGSYTCACTSGCVETPKAVGECSPSL